MNKAKLILGTITLAIQLAVLSSGILNDKSAGLDTGRTVLILISALTSLAVLVLLAIESLRGGNLYD